MTVFALPAVLILGMSQLRGLTTACRGSEETSVADLKRLLKATCQLHSFTVGTSNGCSDVLMFVRWQLRNGHQPQISCVVM